MTRYAVVRRPDLDFGGQAYADSLPNLHRYPATMIPQLGVLLLRELGIAAGTMLDPYCGSGSSIAAGVLAGLRRFHGIDLNPLAIAITRAKFTRLDLDAVEDARAALRRRLYETTVDPAALTEAIPRFPQIDYWFSADVRHDLARIRLALDAVSDADIRGLFVIAFAETVRESSYTRASEFKLYRLAESALAAHTPDAIGMFLQKLRLLIQRYALSYHPLLADVRLRLDTQPPLLADAAYDVILTSPPYGDSRTTVAYGQFSLFANLWLGHDDARGIDTRLMGGRLRSSEALAESSIAPQITAIAAESPKRAQEVAAFYADLDDSIAHVAPAVAPGGYAIYIVGNRRVKGVQLATDQFIAEAFTRYGFDHCATYERRLSNKVMPSRNSPTNRAGETAQTMSQEFIVITRRVVTPTSDRG